ncbi:MAG TPA: FlgO family outer membrane protein [bacterium]|nr:FlgO family outer membrane protein [bacterium]
MHNKRFLLPRSLSALRLSLFFCALLFSACATAHRTDGEYSQDPAYDISFSFLKKSHSLTDKKLAVAEFTDLSGNRTAEARLFAERLTTSLASQDEWNVIERTQLEKVLKEQNFSQSGLVDVATAREMGKILGVEIIVAGTLAQVGSYMEINARGIEVQTGRILLASRLKTRPERVTYTPSLDEKIRQDLSPAQKNEPAQEKAPADLTAEFESVIQEKPLSSSDPVILRQKELLRKAKDHWTLAQQYHKERRPRLMIREAELSIEILRRIIRLKQNSAPAGIAGKHLEKAETWLNAIRKSVRNRR